jgi:LmbE family N-acetylglucosaminyl deacetylase
MATRLAALLLTGCATGSAVGATPAAPETRGAAMGLRPVPTAAPAPYRAPVRGDRLLVVAPHPDDETLCCAGLITRALANGATVRILWVTAGEGFEFAALATGHLRLRGSGMLRLGTRRSGEGRQAATVLGVPGDATVLLGFPDRGLRSLLGSNFRLPLASPYTGTTRVPYPDTQRPGAPNTGESLLAGLAAEIDGFEPTRILAPAPEDLNPDHAATGLAVSAVLAERGDRDALHWYVVHARGWPEPRGLAPERTLPPPPVPARAWRSFELTAGERATKRAALRMHRSQLRVMAPYLNAFVRRNEQFAEAVP